MPNRDKTGPVGQGCGRQGCGNGRGAGRCAGSVAPQNTNPEMNPCPGRGMGRGGRGGLGRGWRHRYNAAGRHGWQRAFEAPAAVIPVPFAAAVDERDINALKGQAESLQKTLDQMQKRIEELEARPKPE
jgi:hypothetical protein